MAGGRTEIARVKGRGYSRSKEPEVRINQRIRAREVRLVDTDGGQLGVVTIKEALDLSEQRGVDLVEVAQNANPPVCRLMDYGKYKYELKKQAAAKKQKSQTVKEIKFRPNIGDHDLDVKIGRIREFLGEDNKTKIRIFFRGREIVHPELGRKLANRILERVADLGGVDIPPKMEGKNLIMVITPNKNTQEKVAQKKITQEKVAAKKNIQDKVVQEEVAQEKVVQEEVTQEEVVQEKVVQEEVTQEEVVQEEVAQEKNTQGGKENAEDENK